MVCLGDGSITAGDTDFDMNLLSEFLFQADEVPTLLDETTMEASNSTTGTQSTDSTSSSDDDGAPPDSPVFAPGVQSDKMMDRKAKRRAQVAVSARRHRYRKKHEMLDLRKEVTDLTERLHSLRCKKLINPRGAVAEAEEYYMAERHKRRQAEQVNEQLRRALVMQRRFFASMQGLVMNSPITNAELNMSSLLHTFTRLGRTAYSRRRDYLSMCSDSKADLAVQILLRETEGMNFAGPPSITTCIIPTLTEQQQIVTTVAAYAFDALDLKNMFVSACSAILGVATDWPQYKTVWRNGEVLDKPHGNITYAKSDVGYRNEDVETENVSVESRSLVFYRMSADYGVLIWDFADQDDLYPVKTETTIKRDLIGAAMVRRELCHDGVERVVYRSICTKLHSFSQPPSTPEVANYLVKSKEGARACGDYVFNYIREQAAQLRTVSV